MGSSSMSRLSSLLLALCGTLTVVLLSACQGLSEAPPPTPGQSQATAEPPPPEPDPAEAQYELAIWSARAGKIEDAIEQFRQLVEMDAGFPRAHTNLGLLLLEKGDAEGARTAFINAIEQDNSDAIAYNHLAIIQRREGQFKEALQNYRKALKIDPDYANAHLNLAILLDIYLQQLPGALDHYEAFQKLTGNDNEVVEKWMIDLKRRIDAGDKKPRG